MRLQRTGKPEALQSLGSQTVGHNLGTEQQRSTYVFIMLFYPLIIAKDVIKTDDMVKLIFEYATKQGQSS